MLVQEQTKVEEEQFIHDTEESNVDLSQEAHTLRCGKCELPADGVFRFGDLQHADLRGADVRGFKVELEDGRQVDLVDVVLTHKKGEGGAYKSVALSLPELNENFPTDYDGTLFSDDPTVQQEICEQVKKRWKPIPKDYIPLGNDYSGTDQQKTREEDRILHTSSRDSYSYIAPDKIEEDISPAEHQGTELEVVLKDDKKDTSPSPQKKDNELDLSMFSLS